MKKFSKVVIVLLMAFVLAGCQSSSDEVEISVLRFKSDKDAIESLDESVTEYTFIPTSNIDFAEYMNALKLEGWETVTYSYFGRNKSWAARQNAPSFVITIRRTQ